jgi:hypothetical protein
MMMNRKSPRRRFLASDDSADSAWFTSRTAYGVGWLADNAARTACTGAAWLRPFQTWPLWVTGGGASCVGASPLYLQLRKRPRLPPPGSGPLQPTSPPSDDERGSVQPLISPARVAVVRRQAARGRQNGQATIVHCRTSNSTYFAISSPCGRRMRSKTRATGIAAYAARNNWTAGAGKTKLSDKTAHIRLTCSTPRPIAAQRL